MSKKLFSLDVWETRTYRTAIEVPAETIEEAREFIKQYPGYVDKYLEEFDDVEWAYYEWESRDWEEDWGMNEYTPPADVNEHYAENVWKLRYEVVEEEEEMNNVI